MFSDGTLSTSFLCCFKFIVIHNSCFQHSSDKTDDIGVFDPWSYKTYDPFMVKMLEEPFNVCIQYITCWFSLQHQVSFSDCIMTSPVGSESHHFIIKHWFKHRFQYSSLVIPSIPTAFVPSIWAWQLLSISLLSRCPKDVNTISGFSFDNCDILADFVFISTSISVYS